MCWQRNSLCSRSRKSGTALLVAGLLLLNSSLMLRTISQRHSPHVEALLGAAIGLGLTLIVGAFIRLRSGSR